MKLILLNDLRIVFLALLQVISMDVCLNSSVLMAISMEGRCALSCFEAHLPCLNGCAGLSYY